MEDRVMGDHLTTLINHNAYHDCLRHSIIFLNSGACHGKEVADFSQNSIHPQRTCEIKEWAKQ